MKTENEVLAELIERTKQTSQAAVAKELGVKPPYINDLVQGRRSISRTIATKLGYRVEVERVVTKRFFPLVQK